MVVALGAEVVVVGLDAVEVVEPPGVLVVAAPPGAVVVELLGTDVVDVPLDKAIPEFRIFLPASVGGNLHAASPAVALLMKSRQIRAGKVPPATD